MIYSIINFTLVIVFTIKLINSFEHSDEFINDLFHQASHELQEEYRLLKKEMDASERVAHSGKLKLRLGANSNSDKDAASLHHSLTRTTEQSQLIHDSFKIALKAFRKLQAAGNQTNQTKTLKLRAPPTFCPFTFEITCDATNKYRQIDGSCNNLENGMIGRSSTPFKRVLRPHYEDKIEKPRRTSVTGEPLPNPRSISLIVHDPLDDPSPLTNLAVMFGQFMDHDFAMTAATGVGNAPLKCKCDSTSADCVNIPTPTEDTFGTDQQCQVLTRSGASFDKFDCTLGNREQTNLLTHWLDMSQTYGSDTAQMNKLRSMTDGLLKTSAMTDFPSKEFLPKAKKGVCVDETDEQLCFESGDTRTSQNMMLVSIHTVWLREHNRIAKALKAMHPTWTDEDLFQEARRITIAQYQNIIYKEWLPAIIGKNLMKIFELNIKKNDFFMGYDSSINPHLSTEFATAAFRFGHSLIRSTISKADDSLKETANLTLSNIMLRPPEAFINGGLDSICRGLLINPGTAFDAHFTHEVQNKLFETNAPDAQTHRFSLSSVNIMRGRDHGIAPYIEFRNFSGLSTPKSFDDIPEIPPATRTLLKRVYKNVSDIDAFTGGMSEFAVDGAVIGPTFSIMVAQQFRELKFGDRYYFESGKFNATKFTLPQLKQLRKSSMSRIMCENLDIKFIQRNAFLPISPDNPLVSCKQIKKVNLKRWQDEPLPQKAQPANTSNQDDDS